MNYIVKTSYRIGCIELGITSLETDIPSTKRANMLVDNEWSVPGCLDAGSSVDASSKHTVH